MTEDIKTVGEMVRITAENQNVFLTQIADHVDNLEATIVQLQLRIAELEKNNE
jgi:hypothetical protein